MFNSSLLFISLSLLFISSNGHYNDVEDGHDHGLPVPSGPPPHHHGHHRRHRPPPPLHRTIDGSLIKSREINLKSKSEFDKKTDSHASIVANWRTEIKEALLTENQNGDKKTYARTIDNDGLISAKVDFDSNLDFDNKNEILGESIKSAKVGINEEKESRGDKKHKRHSKMVKSLKRNKREENVGANNYNVDGGGQSAQEQPAQEPAVVSSRPDGLNVTRSKVKSFFEGIKTGLENGVKKVGEFMTKAGKAMKGVADEVFGKKKNDSSNQ